MWFCTSSPRSRFSLARRRNRRARALKENGHASPLEKVAKCSQRPNTVADDLGDRQHGYGEDRARNTPHPEPEDERDDDEDGIEGEPIGQKHWRYGLRLDQMKPNVKPRRQQRL